MSYSTGCGVCSKRITAASNALDDKNRQASAVPARSVDYTLLIAAARRMV